MGWLGQECGRPHSNRLGSSNEHHSGQAIKTLFKPLNFVRGELKPMA